MGDYQHPDLKALDELEDLLDAYAEARLSPTSPMLARMRRAVLADASSIAATRAAERRLPSKDVATRRAGRLQLPRPVFAAGFAALLALSTGAAVLAAPAGSPFYNARVVLETIFLPTQLADRLAAHQQHLESWLADAEAAAASGNIGALTAALAAYDAEVARAIAEIGNDASLLGHLEAMLARHVGVLTALEAQVPTQASVDRALENSQKAIQAIKEKVRAGKPSDPGSGPPNEPLGGPPNEPPGRRP